MTINLMIMDIAKYFDSKKFMWDGKTYSTEAEALKVKEEYEKESFPTRMVTEENNYFLFTRRVATEIVIDN